MEIKITISTGDKEMKTEASISLDEFLKVLQVFAKDRKDEC